MRALVSTLLLAALALAGCSDDKDGGDGDGTTTTSMTQSMTGGMDHNATTDLSVAATGIYPVTIAYSPSSLSAPAGSMVNLTFSNEDTNAVMQHNWVLEGVDGAATDTIGTGETATVGFMAPEAGEYVFFCSVQGHRDAGMEGTFTVTETA